jgi:hypothetical protein
VLLATDREIKGFCPPALLLISYNNFASSAVQYTEGHSTLDGLVLWQLCTLCLQCSAVQYTASHSNPGWSCVVAILHALLAVRYTQQATSTLDGLVLWQLSTLFQGDVAVS